LAIGYAANQHDLDHARAQADALLFGWVTYEMIEAADEGQPIAVIGDGGYLRFSASQLDCNMLHG
jgi:hypothetical protein